MKILAFEPFEAKSASLTHCFSINDTLRTLTGTTSTGDNCRHSTRQEQDHGQCCRGDGMNLCKWWSPWKTACMQHPLHFCLRNPLCVSANNFTPNVCCLWYSVHSWHRFVTVSDRPRTEPMPMLSGKASHVRAVVLTYANAALLGERAVLVLLGHWAQDKVGVHCWNLSRDWRGRFLAFVLYIGYIL